MRPILTLFLITGLMILLAACQPSPPPLAFEGTSTTDGAEHPLSVSLNRQGDRLLGDYQVRAARGTFRGAVVDTLVTAELNASPTCTFAFEGTLTETTLTGAFQPADCPGGQGGSWNLERR